MSCARKRMQMCRTPRWTGFGVLASCAVQHSTSVFTRSLTISKITSRSTRILLRPVAGGAFTVRPDGNTVQVVHRIDKTRVGVPRRRVDARYKPNNVRSLFDPSHVKPRQAAKGTPNGLTSTKATSTTRCENSVDAPIDGRIRSAVTPTARQIYETGE